MGIAGTHGRIWSILRKVLLAVGVAAVVLVLMLWLMGTFEHKVSPSARGDEPAGRSANDATLVAVTRIDVPAIESAVGTIQPVYQAAVASKLLEKVTEVNVRAGQPVAKGELLVKLDDTFLRAQLQQAEAALASAQASLAQAQTEYRSTTQAYEHQAATKTELDRTRTTVDTAQAQVHQAEQVLSAARATLNYTSILSPMDGTVVEKNVNVGDTVSPGQVLLTLYDPTRMQLIASVRESLTQRLKVGQKIDVYVSALGKTCHGTVSEIVPESQSVSRTFSVKVTGPCQSGVYTGMFGRLLIPLDMESVLLIPSAAVRRIGQLDMVDVAQKNQLYRRSIRLGRSFGDWAEVLAGLEDGEQVAVAKGSKIVPPATQPSTQPAAQPAVDAASVCEPDTYSLAPTAGREVR